MRILPKESFAHVFAHLQGLRVGVVDGIGNVGDYLLYAATRQLLDDFGIEWVSTNIISHDDPRRQGVDHLLLFAGGNMGYGPCTAIRERALSYGIPATLLPQSWLIYESGPYDRMFAREHQSMQICMRTELAPDLALGFDFPESETSPTLGKGLFCRRFGNQLFPDHRGSSDPAEYCHTIDAYAKLAARYSHVVTDRLHFAITALGMRRKVTLLPVSYHKNRSMWETSLRQLGVAWAERP